MGPAGVVAGQEAVAGGNDGATANALHRGAAPGAADLDADRAPRDGGGGDAHPQEETSAVPEEAPEADRSDRSCHHAQLRQPQQEMLHCQLGIDKAFDRLSCLLGSAQAQHEIPG